MPGVLESAVIGMPHPDFGEVMAAGVTPHEGVKLDTGHEAAAGCDQMWRGETLFRGDYSEHRVGRDTLDWAVSQR